MSENIHVLVSYPQYPHDSPRFTTTEWKYKNMPPHRVPLEVELDEIG